MTGPSRRLILRKAWPIILANAATPLLGLTDTAVIGNTGSAVGLGAIALGAFLFSFVYWTFGFLRMGTTGFVAQADGAGDELEIRLSLGRSLVLALGIGTLILLLQGVIAGIAFPLFDASDAVIGEARRYFFLRIWGAPAALALYSLMGLFIGLGMSRQVLALQLLLNGLNIFLDILLGGKLGWGTAGIALGTAISEWSVAVTAAMVALGTLRKRHRGEGAATPFWDWKGLVETKKLLSSLSANRDIFLRTLCILIGFGWFTRQGAQFGDAVLAANHILIQMTMFCAFFLDGFAFVTESQIGNAVGRRDRSHFDRAFWRTMELSGLTAMIMALVFAIPGAWVIDALSDQPEVVAVAGEYRFWAAFYVLVSFAAFQLDGVFIGATRGPEMRNASLISLIVFLVAWWLLEDYGNTGLWGAFVIYVVVRAVALAVHVPALRRSMAPGVRGCEAMDGI